MVRDAIGAHTPLDSHAIKFLQQGSYYNNTNVRQESDVDICVCCTLPFFTDFTNANYISVQGQTNSPYSYFDFKNDVELALREKFGTDGYSRGAKAFNVHPNGYRTHADVVAALEYREYLYGTPDPFTNAPLASYTMPTGTKFLCDTSCKAIVNWPDQHHDNGVAKNARTGNRYKYIVRALKRLKLYMVENGKPNMKSVPSYLIECLVYCAQDFSFGSESYYENMKSVLANAIVGTGEDENCKSWKEVNEKKLLFGASQPWTRQTANDFCIQAWLTVGFGT